MNKKLFWYVVYWRNKLFFKTKYKPSKIGSVLGMKEKPQLHQGYLSRAGFHRKTGTFRIVEKYAYLGYMTRKEFKKWILNDET